MDRQKTNLLPYDLDLYARAGEATKKKVALSSAWGYCHPTSIGTALVAHRGRQRCDLEGPCFRARTGPVFDAMVEHQTREAGNLGLKAEAERILAED